MSSQSHKFTSDGFTIHFKCQPVCVGSLCTDKCPLLISTVSQISLAAPADTHPAGGPAGQIYGPSRKSLKLDVDSEEC